MSVSSRARIAALFDYFVEEVFADNTEPILAAARTSLSEDDNVLVTGVSGNPYAVGFFGYAYYDANRDALAAASIAGIAPQASAVDAGAYPLARPLFMYAAPEIIAEKPQVGDFLAYYLAVVNEEVNAVGYFPADPYGLKPREIPGAGRPGELMPALAPAVYEGQRALHRLPFSIHGRTDSHLNSL